MPRLSRACPADTLRAELARHGLYDGISQGLVEAGEGEVSLMLSLSTGLWVTPAGQGQLAITLLGVIEQALQNGIASTLCLQSAECPCSCVWTPAAQVCCSGF